MPFSFGDIKISDGTACMATRKSDTGHETLAGQIGAAGDVVHFSASEGLD
jgi:hypothetical protein